MNGYAVATVTIDHYVSTLAGQLQGHRRDKSRLLGEIRDGLIDSATAKIEQGLPADEASQMAVSTFGSVTELVQACQPELSVRQVRRTSSSVAVIIPALIGGWHVYASSLPNPNWEPNQSTTFVVASFAGVSALAAVLSVLVLVTTGRWSRRLPAARHLASVVTLMATISIVSMSVGMLILATGVPVVGFSPAAALAATGAAAVLVALARSAHTCLRCARRMI